MFLLILFLICIFVTLGIGVLAAVSDVRSLTIPNAYSVVVMATFFAVFGVMALAGGPQDVFGSLLSHLLSAGIMFIVTVILFAVRAIGAGDSKFATACALWVSVPHLPIFIFYMTLGGAVLGAAALYIRKHKPVKAPIKGGWIDQVQGGASKVPYGVAITFGMVIAFLSTGYFSADVMSSFLSAGSIPPGS